MSLTIHQDIDTLVESKQFLSFILAGDEYATDILKVQEIRDWTSTTLVPNSPTYIEGVLNLRGEIIPIINLRTRFGLPDLPDKKNRIVIVLNIVSDQKRRLMGLLVDAFSETYDIPLEKIKSAPNNISVIDDDFISGLTTVDEKMVILLDVDELMNSNELSTDCSAATA
ncbi:chemotaxis protein CheW [Psychrobium sp. 1_MG-2023]|uniref:chemotaxis protein CheW n=1 Tax=Psychrobium sp. 1_MG-2023 TaxID=3062624 RepID=UPI000C337765|nr:chemotaxis protein CheW [Psychrobium sp. 1_MG-2023]MDP2560148.1 chemotaxis protein CheW [Psychrobium sp. 1_MG-2023]PKF56961.1 chemotaxis protein CheW [Alteromonadales bacterium alter-6D02]